MSLWQNILFLFGSWKCTTSGVSTFKKFWWEYFTANYNIYNLEVAFDPKSAFNYHFSYSGKKNILSFPQYSKLGKMQLF